MIKSEELIIQRRGHDAGVFLEQGWSQCVWCGMWLRKVVTLEQREDEPPEDEQCRLTRREKS
jgi:hypothetical protein